MQKSKVYQEAFQNAITLGYNKGKQDYKQKKPYKAVIENIIIPSSVIDKEDYKAGFAAGFRYGYNRGFYDHDDDNYN